MGENPGLEIGQLVRDYHQIVYRCAFRLAGSVADAEDLTQQVFLVAQQKLGQVRQADRIRSWLLMILRNCFLKGCQRQRLVLSADMKLNLDSLPSEAAEETNIDGERLQAALNLLPPNYRLALVLFYFEECSYREIAERLDTPIGTVMSRLARGKAFLREKLFELDQQAGVRGQKAASTQKAVLP